MYIYIYYNKMFLEYITERSPPSWSRPFCCVLTVLWVYRGEILLLRPLFQVVFSLTWELYNSGVSDVGRLLVCDGMPKYLPVLILSYWTPLPYQP